MGFIAWSLAIVAFLTLLWTFSDAGKCLIKWGLFVIISICAATLPIPIMLLRPRDPKNAL